MRLAGPAVFVLALASSAAAAPTVTATLTTSTAAPVVGEPWRFVVTAESAAGKPLQARMRLQILRRGTVVGCWKGAAVTTCSGASAGTWIVFRGNRPGVINWPARWLGMKLTFQATVLADAQTLRLRTPLSFRRRASSNAASW